MLQGVMVRAWHLRFWRQTRTLFTRPIVAFRFLFLDKETTNFTYPIRNQAELSQFLAKALGSNEREFANYLGELDGDSGLRRILEERTAKHGGRNRRVQFGRRAGWYALVRFLKPRVVVETGTHDGLGTAVLARALQRNADEGHKGLLYTFDLDEDTGWLVPETLHAYVRFVHGDIKKTLPAALPELKAVDLFLHDSDHSYEHETLELTTVFPILPSAGVLASDNSHTCKALEDFARTHELAFQYWGEKPKGHPYPGAGLGLALRTRTASGTGRKPQNAASNARPHAAATALSTSF